MNPKFNLISLILFLGLIACSDSTENTGASKSRTSVISNDSIRDLKEPQKVSLSNFDDYLIDFSRRRTEIVQKLEKCTPQEANQLFLEYRKMNLLNGEKMTNVSLKMLDDYGGLYSDLGGLNYSGKHKEKITQLLKAGLEPWYIGEGMTEIRVRPFEYDHLFSGRLTPDFEEFMQNIILDEQKLVTNDAALAISWEELAYHIIRWESFIKKYPNTTLKKEAKETYAWYQILFVVGVDNTPTFEFSTGEIYDENMLMFEWFNNYYNSELTTQLIEVLKNTTGTYEVKYAAVKKKQRELLKKM